MNTDDLVIKWSSFGWDTVELDGHNLENLYDYFKAPKSEEKPKAIIANTLKGKGFSFSENNKDWHHAVLSKAMYEKAMKEIKN